MCTGVCVHVNITDFVPICSMHTGVTFSDILTVAEQVTEVKGAGAV